MNVLTQHNDNYRTGANLNETILNTSNVNVNTFGLLFSRSVDNIVLAQPLYVANLTINGGQHNVVFVATENNSVYAFDADDPSASTPLWQVSLGTAVPGAQINGGGYGENGVTGTPVIDLTTNTMYVVAMTVDGQGNQHHFLHALDITTGQDKTGSPVEITGSVHGNNPQDSVNGIVTFNPAQHMLRPALLLSNGVLYIGAASHNDTEPYHGWVFAYNAATLQREAIFNTTPNGSEGGIWQSGNGMVADGAAGDIYLSVGNSAKATENATGDYGESIMRLRLSGNAFSVIDFFEPNDYDMLNARDLDVGSGGVLEMPDLGLIVGGGKAGVIYVANKSNLGGLHLAADQVYQEFQACPEQVYGSPVYWNNLATGPTIYVWGVDDVAKAYSMGTQSTFITTPSSQASIQANNHGGSVSISANGNIPGTGILWALGQNGSTPLLAAYDATNLNTLLWSSQQDAARDATQSLAQWVPPTIANGKVYVPNFSGQLLVYGLLGPTFSISASPSAINVAPNAQATSVITINPEDGFNSSVTLTANNLPTGVTAAFTPLTSTTQQMTLTATSSAQAGYTPFTVTGTSGTTQNTANLRLYVSSQPGVVLGAGLQMFSEPYDCSAVPLSQLFGGPETLAVWSPASGKYALSPNPPADAVRLGQGYWVRLAQQTELSNLGAPADTTTNFSIPLGTGWNQIGNPFLAATSIGALQFTVNGTTESFASATTGAQPAIGPALWGYDPTAASGSGAYYPLASTDSLEPGQGYWIDVLSSNSVTLIVPHP